jgi:uncharacterized protein YdhG (YjbR/CyaY superfamily)
MKKPARAAEPTTEAAPPAAADKAVPAKKKTQLPETTEGFPWPSNHEIKKESNPFTERDWRMWLYAWSGLIVRFTIILGAIFTIYQYLANREQTRVQRTLELVELWEKPEYQDAQRAVKQRLTDLNEKYASLLGANPSQKELAIYYDRIGIEAMTDSGGTMPLAEFSGQFDRVVYFLNRVAFCVEGNICSQRIADAYFRDYAESFWQYFAGYIAKQRKAGASSYAQPIENYLSGS